MTDDEDWYEPTPWGWLGNSITVFGFVLTACVLHFVVYPRIPKPPTYIQVQQFNIAAKNRPAQYCSIGGLYYDGVRWRCV